MEKLKQLIKKIIDKIKKYFGYNYPYNIVTSAYNCEKYLDKYFETIVNQSIGFKKFIRVVIVDDGSTDGSADIIKKWRKKYPINIKYIYCENAGQAKARNLAIKKIKSGFVTFIDGDDFISEDYFKTIDNFLKKNKKVEVVSCNQVFYIEKTKEIKEHYLAFRFKKKSSVVSADDMKGFIQTTASSVLFKTKHIKQHQLYFDEKVKPIYEDGHFVNRLFIFEPNIKIGFLSKPVYYWRKRENLSSTVDKAWLDKRRFDDALRYGILDLLKKANEKFGYVPVYLQRFALYHISWYFNKIVFKNFSLGFLEENEIDRFKSLVEQIFFYIEIDTIKKSKLGAMYHKIKLGMLRVYKQNSIFDTSIFYIDDYDIIDKIITIRYYHQEKVDNCSFGIDGKELSVLSKSTKELFFIDQSFVFESIVTIQIEDISDFLFVTKEYEKLFFSLNKTRYEDKIKIEKIKEIYG